MSRDESGVLEIEARTLLEIVEQSMSSEIYELMKRSRVAVVEKRTGAALRRGLRARDDRRVVAKLPELPTAVRLRPPGEPGDVHTQRAAERHGTLASCAASSAAASRRRAYDRWSGWTPRSSQAPERCASRCAVAAEE